MTRGEWLTRLLLAHAPGDAREAGHRARMLALLESADAPFSARSFAPGHFTASAFVLSPGGDALLLIHHARLRKWLQPGGHVEPEDHDLLEAARREVREEVGLNDLAVVRGGVFDVDVHPIPASSKAPAHEHFDVRFLLQASRSELTPGSDARAAEWVPIGQVAGFQPDESVQRPVRKLDGSR